MFHLLKIFSVLDLSQRDVPVYVSGFIDENSALMKELHKYFLHASFGHLADGISLDDGFAEYPSHFFNSISNLAVCVLSEVH